MSRAFMLVMLVCLFVFGLAGSVISPAAPRTHAAPDMQLTTPQLIEAAQARGELDVTTADLYLAYAFANPNQLPVEFRSSVPWHGTLPLLHLQKRIAAMNNTQARNQLERILTGSCGNSSTTLLNVTNTAHFHVQYDNTIGGGLTINEYATSLETAWTKQVTTFGWPAPPVLTSNPPPGNLYHVRIEALGGGLYGFVSASGAHAGFVGDNPNTAWNDGDASASCMVLNNNYSGFPGTPQRALDATTAHEFNHSLQFGVGGLAGANEPDDIYAEGLATLMEDEVSDAANDNYNYLYPNFTQSMGAYTPSPYPYWLVFRAMFERYGSGTAGGVEQVMQDFWEATSQNTGDNLSAINLALVNKGTNLADAYHTAAIAMKFLKTCGGGYAYPYCFEEAAGYIGAKGSTAVHGAIAAIGNNYNGSIADNYALNWIALPTGAYTVTLQNTSSGGSLRTSIVCDTGAALNITALPSIVGPGTSTAISVTTVGCSQAVAVITNQSQTANHPTSSTSRSYLLTASNLPPPILNKFVYLPLVVGPPPVFAITNGDFEGGSTGWTQSSSTGALPLIVTTFPTGLTPHSGLRAVWLGGVFNDVSSIQQTITVGAGAPYLAYWHRIASADSCGNDTGQVQINGVVVDAVNLCTSNNTGGWVKRVVNLSAYVGTSVTLQIRSSTNGTLNSNWFIDDVALQNSPSRTLAEDAPTKPAGNSAGTGTKSQSAD